MSSHTKAQTSPTVPVLIVVGPDVDAAAMPLTFQRNCVVMDMLRCYSCPPFLWSKKQNGTLAVVQNSDVFEWFLDPFPVVGVDDMKKFHAESYVRFLAIRETLSELDETASAVIHAKAEEIQPIMSRRTITQRSFLPRQFFSLLPVEADKDYNLVGDTFPFLGMWRTIQATLSGTLTAVRLLAQPGRFAALYWFGGRSHAHANAAGNFCFVNDVVFGVYEMQKLLPALKNHILVVDVDSCHGDGTQEAFLHDLSVLTLSMHAYGVGVRPGTGGIEEIGVGSGRGYTMNVPLPVGATDSIAVPLMTRAISFALGKIGGKLGAIVIVCGSDSLSGDPLGHLNLTVGGLQCIVRALLKEAARRSLKVLILGAAGHVDVSCARLAGVVTRDVLSCAAAVRRGDADYFGDSADMLKDFAVAVPEECQHFTRYGPSFLMHGLPTPRFAKAQQLPQDSPLFLRIQKVAEKRALHQFEKNGKAKEEESSYSSDFDEEDEEEEDESEDDEEEDESEDDEESEDEEESEEEDEDEEDEDDEEEDEDNEEEEEEEGIRHF